MACGSGDSRPPPYDDLDPVQCTDNDADGFGDGCARGLDCDDDDPQVTRECFQCSDTRPHCTCSTEGQYASCGKVETEIAGQITCGMGDMACHDGFWGECIINKSVTLLPGGDPKSNLQSLGSSSGCTDPCDPYCHNWVDTPTNLSDPDAGIVASDAGISLPQSDIPVVVQSACSGGAAGGCSHHVCATGSALTKDCDGAGLCLSSGSACTSSSACCYGLVCSGGTCSVPNPGGRVIAFSDTFAGGNTKGWSLSGEWGISSAVATTGAPHGNNDPASDATDTADNMLAGVSIGAFVSKYNHGYHYLTSPVIDASGSSGTLTLEFKRWLNSDVTSQMNNRVQVYSAGTWTTLWSSGSTSVLDSSWQSVSFDISAYRSQTLQVRFGFQIGTTSGLRTVSGWNLDDVVVASTSPVVTCANEGAACASGGCCSSSECTGGICTTPPSCVTQVCNSRPSCCSTKWDIECVKLVDSVCGRECAMNGASECVLCYQDSVDHDGDGYSYTQGDCKDCDPKVNPGALDLPANGFDEDCDGVIDNEPTDCDTGLSFGSSDPKDFARAIDLCRFTTASATGPSKTWGVVSATFARADGSNCSDSLQRAIMTRFGTNNSPQHGQRMASFSSGTARDRDDSGFVNPNGQISHYDAKTFASPPSGFPKSAAGCPNGTAAYDSCGLKLKVRAPTNVASLSYGFNFFSSEYPEWVCDSYNDSYIAIYDSVANPLADKNISFDSKGNPVSVNIGFFSVPGTLSDTTHPVLLGTGYDGSCKNTNLAGSPSSVCGGSTNWLTTTAPVSPGEEFELMFVIWDTGDHKWDSLVLLDNFQWSSSPATISTLPTPVSSGPELQPGDFVRIYDANDACGSSEFPLWSLWSWVSLTPSDSDIEFFVSTASTEAALETATEVPLRFTDPPGPSALSGNAAVAAVGSLDTQNGSVVVDTTLLNAGLSSASRFLKIRSRLNPSTDKQSGPTLVSWNLDVSCRPNQ